MGENFLHSATLIAGEDAVMSALGELHVSELGKEPRTVEERIYGVFLKHVPVERKDSFIDLYRDLHGGAAAFEDSNFSDDHGDEASAVTDVELQEVIQGELDYMWDFDYFRFSAQSNQKYSITVNHDTLRASSIGLYGPDGKRGENKSWISRELVPGGPRIVWVAPTSEDFYVAVHNFGGKTGTYTLMITPVENSSLDDHHDTASLATEILVETVVEGAISDDLDIDYFAMRQDAGQKYRLLVERKTLGEYSFRVVLSDGRFWRYNLADSQSDRWSRPGFTWTARSSEKATIAIQGYQGSTGTYSLKIVPDGN